MNSSSKKAAFIGLLIVNFFAMFLISGVGVYSYTIAAQYDSIASVAMIFTLECVARSVSIPLGGKIGDKIGHKKNFLIALALYIVSYAAAACAAGFWMFTIARMVSGFAWGMFMMNGFVLITNIFGQKDAPKYSGYNQALTTVAMIAAAPVAGVLCNISWRLFFFISLAFLVVGFFLCLGMPETATNSKSKASLDIGGVVCTAVILIPFSLAMNFGSVWGWTSASVLIMLAVAVIGLICLVFFEKKSADPVYPFKLLKNKAYLSILMLMFLFSIANGAANTYNATYAQYVLQSSSTVAGLINVPGMIAAVALTTYFGTQASKTGKYKGMVIFWTVGSLVGSVIWMIMSGTSNLTAALIMMFVGALPVAAVNSANQIAPYTYPITILKPEDLASGLAFMGLAGAVGSTMAGGISSAVVNAAGMSGVYWVPAVCSVLMIIFTVMFKDHGSKQL